jgi:hypothetical protein
LGVRRASTGRFRLRGFVALILHLAAVEAAWNERQIKRMPMLFSPTIGAAIAV